MWTGAAGVEGALAVARLGPNATSNAIDGRELTIAWNGRLFDGPPTDLWDGRPADRFANHFARSYLSYGDRAAARLTGDFACALWDAHQGCVVLFTDPFAQRPLFYAAHPTEPVFAFASHSACLRALAWVGNELDGETVVDILLDRPWVPGRTPLRNIAMVPAGHCVVWRTAEHREVPRARRYWGPRFASSAVRSREECLEAFAATFRDAVGQRMAGAGGCTTVFMSGGFDSTSIAGVAASLTRGNPSDYGPVATVSAKFGTLPCDESSRIDIMRTRLALHGSDIAALTLELSVVDIQREVVANDFPRFNLQQSLLQAELDAASAQGATVVLTGVGGDEVVDDTAYDRDLLEARGAHHLFSVARMSALIRGRSTADVMLRLARAAAPIRLKRAWRMIKRATAPQSIDPRTCWLQPEWHERNGHQVERSQSMEHDWGMVDQAAEVFDTHWQRSIWALLQRTNLQYGQRGHVESVLETGMGYGAPFLDRRLIELVLGTPARWLPRTSDAGQYKPFIGEGLRTYVPRELTQAYWKVDFGSYNQPRFRRAIDEVEAWLFTGPVWLSQRFVDRESAHRILRSFRSLHDAGDSMAQAAMMKLYGIVGLEAWLRQL